MKSKRQREVEREWKRLERKEWVHGVLIPVAGLLLGAIFVGFGMERYPMVFEPLCAAMVGLGVPLSMWMNRRKK